MRLKWCASVLCVACTAGPAMAQQRADLSRMYERRGACGAVKDMKQRSGCFEQLSADVLLLAEELLAKPSQVAKPAAPERRPEEAAREQRRAEAVARRKQFDPVIRAFVALQTSTESGVTWNQYGPYVQSASAELAMLKQLPLSTAGAKAASEFSVAAEAHQDALIWWERDINFYARSGNGLAYMGGLPFAQVGLEPMVAKWGMLTQRADIWGINQGVPRAAALATMWTSAEQAMRRAQSYLSEEQAELEK